MLFCKIYKIRNHCHAFGRMRAHKVAIVLRRVKWEGEAIKIEIGGGQKARVVLPIGGVKHKKAVKKLGALPNGGETCHAVPLVGNHAFLHVVFNGGYGVLVVQIGTNKQRVIYFADVADVV